ncbi:BLUF domain-containing protein [Psychroserpens sp.]|uniref:BLUF domain-containing protein n=1 Tax=Psychroserpens sp. TaxID=2020870 RepID=UPI003C767BCB
MKKISSVEAVQELAFMLNGVSNECIDSDHFSIDNEAGKGSIHGTSLFSGLEVLSFDLYLKKLMVFNYHSNSSAYLHCIFIEEGFLSHNFQHSENSNNASRYQNILVGSTSEDYSTFKIPADTRIKMVIITVQKIPEDELCRGHLQNKLNEILEQLSLKNTYSYFGNYSSKGSSYAKSIIELKSESLNDRLSFEANVLNLLSCKFKEHEEHLSLNSKECDLSKSEIINVIRTSEYIANNLEQSLKLVDLERESGLNQKRIQRGFKHFFGLSVNKYIVNLRIEKAKELIETTDKSISEIVYHIGLNSRSYFSRIFSEKFGLLPNEYRKNFNLYNPTYELCYFSKANGNLLKSDIDEILQESKINNLTNEITGCLMYHNLNFIQILEGSKDVVLKVYKSICEDKRHTKVTMLYDGFKSGRTFNDWTMGFIEKPSLFDSESLANFNLVNMELVLEVNKIKPKDNADRLRIKLMWERARNTLIAYNFKETERLKVPIDE